LSASVISTSCLNSDATATGLLVMGLEKAINYLKNHKELEAYLIYTDEKGNYLSYATVGFAQLIIEEN
jgi:thiamine biosynthesis lipoprotein